MTYRIALKDVVMTERSLVDTRTFQRGIVDKALPEDVKVGFVLGGKQGTYPPTVRSGTVHGSRVDMCAS